MTIYRGYDIKRTEDGAYKVHSFGSHPVIAEIFESEDDAINGIDATYRQVRRDTRGPGHHGPEG